MQRSRPVTHLAMRTAGFSPLHFPSLTRRSNRTFDATAQRTLAWAALSTPTAPRCTAPWLKVSTRLHNAPSAQTTCQRQRRPCWRRQPQRFPPPEVRGSRTRERRKSGSRNVIPLHARPALTFPVPLRVAGHPNNASARSLEGHVSVGHAPERTPRLFLPPPFPLTPRLPAPWFCPAVAPRPQPPQVQWQRLLRRHSQQPPVFHDRLG